MDIEFRELVAILKIDAPVHFTPKEMLNKKDYVYCKFMHMGRFCVLREISPKEWKKGISKG